MFFKNGKFGPKNYVSEDPKMNGTNKEKFRTWKELTKMTRIMVEDLGVKKTSKKRNGKKEQGKNREERNTD